MHVLSSVGPRRWFFSHHRWRVLCGRGCSTMGSGVASQKPDRKVSKAFIFLEGINAAKNLRSGVNEG